MVKRHLLAAFLVSVICAAPVAADTISFDPDGGGALPAVNIGSLDWAPGNAIGLEVTASSPVGTTFQLFYQSNLAIAIDPADNPVYLNNTGGAGTQDSFTLVLGFSETIVVNDFVPATNTGDLEFAFDPTGFNAFAIFANNVPGVPLTGVCFVCGTLVMSGSIIPDGFVSNFSGSGGALQDLDGTANGNDYPGVTSIVGTGSVTLTGAVDFYNTDYFNGLNGATIDFAFANANTKLPFQEVNPSACFFATSGGAPTCTGGFEGVGSVGAINGISGENIMFQADGNNSFNTVPEPASLTLLGLGLLGSAAVARRRQRGAKK